MLWILSVAAVVDAALIGLVTGPASSERHWPGLLDWLRIHPWQSLIAFTAAAAIVAILVAALSEDSHSPIDLRKAADDLAIAVRNDWEYELQRWRVHDPYPLPVRWAPADPNVFAGWSALVRLARTSPRASRSGRWSAGPKGLAGANDLARVLDRVPTGRLVVLGRPGAGKTILLVRLVLDLLSQRPEGGQVPVLLPLASWNAAEEDLRSWIARWLATARADLTRPAGPGTSKSLARALLDADLILPVLDGLDEIPDELIGLAITRINDAVRLGQGYVLAARTKPFRAAVHGSQGADVMLTGAAGVELRPLEASEVADYLKESAGGPAGAARWDPVIAAFTTDEPPPVADVLKIPLMVALARAVYNPRLGEAVEAVPLEPVELLDKKRFPTSKHIEDYLYDSFVQAAYRPHPNPEHDSHKYRWNVKQAERWLVFLAQNLEYRQNRATDFAWWELPSALSKHSVSLTLALMLGIVAAVGYSFVGFGAGVFIGLLAGLLVRKKFRNGKVGIVRGLAGGLLGGASAGLIALAVLGPGARDYRVGTFIAGGLGIGIAVAPLAQLLPGLTAGFLGGISVGFYEHAPIFQTARITVGSASHLLDGVGIGLAAFLTVELVGRRVPAKELRWSRSWAVCGAGCGLVIGLIMWVQAGWVVGLIAGVAATIAGGFAGLIGETVTTNLTQAADPIGVLRRDRATFLKSWLGLGVALGFSTGLAAALSPGPNGQTNGYNTGLEIGLTNILVAGLGFAFIQATWGQFTIARCRLAISRRLPWRLMTFLHDASTNRGVLRQFGAAYQFRHIGIQQRLARSIDLNEMED